MPYHRFLPTFLLLCLTILMGCAQEAVETGPSYADLVVTYNAELANLDRLEAKREKLVAEFAAATKPPEPKVGGGLEDLLKAASALTSETGELDTTADPNDLLDQLADRSGSAQDIATKLLEGLAGDGGEGGEGDEAAGPESVEPVAPVEPTPEETAMKSKFEASLAELDKEIADQKTRVAKAREARDAATAESES